MRALVPLLVVAALALPVATAGAQDPGDAFGPLPQAPTPTAEPIVVPDPDDGSSDENRSVLYVIGAGLLITFFVIGRFIMRDARRHTPAESRRDEHLLREQGPHRHAKHAKAQARAKGKAQRAARRRNR